MARKRKNKRLENWACALIVLALLSIMGGVGTLESEDMNQNKIEKRESTNRFAAFAAMGAGLASMYGAAVLLAKRDKGQILR